MKKASVFFGVFYFLSFVNSWGQLPTNAVMVVPDLFFYLSPLNPKYKTPDGQIDSAEEIYSLVVDPSMLTTNPSTSYIYYRLVPFDEEFDFYLRDDNGREVPKTTYGLSISKPVTITEPDPPSSSDGWKLLIGLHSKIDKFRPRNGGFVAPLFRAEDAFVMTNKGVYDLTVRIRIYPPMTNGIPDLSAMRNYFSMIRSPQFGLVTSPPFHAKIIKLHDSPPPPPIPFYRKIPWLLCVKIAACLAAIGVIVWYCVHRLKHKRPLEGTLENHSQI